ncbi:MAG: hypothetical protein KAJ42_09055, partial [Gemmatimonadetes bacterium]|nr:hypothetical protein [Gemmatimonadota bacterium]
TPASLTIREASTDFTWADSPWREIPTSYTTWSNIDGVLNPLLEGNQGRRLVDGWTLGVEGALEFQVGPRLAGYVRPRLWASGVREGDTEQGIGLQEGYVRAVLGNLSVEVGRNHLFLGQGLTAGAIASHNPRGFDMIRLSSDRPFRLPWILSLLGPASVSVLAADMGSDRVIPHSKVFIGKLSIRPHPNLELGATLLNQQLGEGGPEGSWGDRLKDLFLPGIVDQYTFSEKMAGVDARLTLPGSGVELYFDGATTDINLHRTGEMLWDEASWVWGLYLPTLGLEGRGSLRLEAHRVGVRPYTHGDYRSGMTLDGLVMGNPLGPMGTGFSARVGWSGAANDFAVAGTWERHSGDRYQHNGLEGADFRLDRIEDNPDEIRARIVGEWSRNGVGQRVRPRVRLGYERVERFALTDESRTNLLLSVWLSIYDPL